MKHHDHPKRTPLMICIIKGLCPNCRASMTEVDRLFENGALFIWHECPQACCEGQWLDKKCYQNVHISPDPPAYAWISPIRTYTASPSNPDDPCGKWLVRPRGELLWSHPVL